ncbi:ABC1 family-domain-containing protein [Pholiota molesta]|nr:ABC1 family-domain-containing protein [Pholiota molesta]
MLRLALRVPRRPLLWAVPLCAAGGALLVLRRPAPPSLLSSPALIPCRPVIFSPSEAHRDVPTALRAFLRDRVWEPLLTARRFVYLLYLFAPLVLASPVLLTSRSDWWYELLVARMEAAGPTFIKLAQWAASRVDLFPAGLCERLGMLHSQATPHPMAHTRRVIERVFQRPFDQVFDAFDPVPIGSGAIAQDPLPSVPTASVAIKILHPHVASTINRDLRIMRVFARLINLLPGMQWLSLPEEVAVFGSMMRQQLDLRHEADNLSIFEANFAPRRVPVTSRAPQSVVHPDLLVEEYMNTLPLELFLRNGAGPFDYQIATIGLDAFLNMLLLDNFVHADLHPGNIMIKFSRPPTTRMLLKNIYVTLFHSQPEAAAAAADYSDSDTIAARLRSLSSSPPAWHAELATLYREGYIPEIVFIDAGLVTTLDARNRQNFLDLFRAVAEFDGYRTGQLMVERSRSPHLARDPETFALKMQHLVLRVKRKTFSLGQIRIADLLGEVLRNVRVHHVKMEADFINTVISILLLEGIGRQLDPELDLFASALPMLRTLSAQMATRENVTKDLPSNNLGALLKIWVWVEARSFISSAIVNADELVKYDMLSPSI